MTNALSEMVMTGQVRSNSISFVAERADEDGEKAYDTVTADVRKWAMVLPITQEMAGDRPMAEAYGGRAKDLFERGTLSQAVEEAVEKAIAGSRPQRKRVLPLETNAHALRRAERSIERRGFDGVTSVRLAGDRGLAGAFSQAGLWRQGEPTVEVLPGGDEFFRDLCMLRVSQGIAVTVYRPSAFATVRLRTWPHRLSRRLRRPFR